jgi:transposase
MPRFKTPDYGLKMIPVDFQRQVLPGSFEFALCHLVDKELDLSALRSRFRNDAGGAPAFDPAVLLKIVLLAYSRGLVSSRSIEAACRHNVLFMAVSGDACPHFTTLAAFVSELGDEVARLFAQVLVVCDRQKLIGRALFAIDGVKLPSNASKEKSGTRADFERQAAKMEAAVKAMMERQVAADALPTEVDEARATRERLSREAAQIRQWLAEHPTDRQGSKGSTRLSNRTDNAAKMATGKGVIQGYTGVAAVDDQAQIILDAGRAPGRSPCRLPLGETRRVRSTYIWLSPAPPPNRSPTPCGNESAKMARPANASTARQGLHFQRLRRDEIPRGRAGLHALPATPAVPARTRHHQGPASRLLPGQARWPAKPYRPDESEDRLGRRQAHDCGPLCDGGTGVRQPAPQQTAHPLHPAGPGEGGWAVEALLHDAQHREAGAPWLWGMKRRKGPGMPLKA